MDKFTKPVEKLMVLATSNPEVAAEVVKFTDDEFEASIFREGLIHVRDAMRIALKHEPYKVTAHALRVYVASLHETPIKRAAFTNVADSLTMAYRKADDDPLIITLLMNDHAEAAKEARAKAKLATNPFEAIRELRALGYDEKKLDSLKRAIGKRAQRRSTLDIIADTTINEDQPIVDGLVRRGEVCNVVAAPKARKSWLVHDLAISLEHGTPWLGFQCNKSRVLIIDNELRLATLKKRLATIYDAKGVKPTGRLFIESVRGRSLNIENIPELIKGGNFDVIILDALYRFFPPGFDENSNAHMTRLYNELDEVATETGAAVFVVHHASKGGQSAKSVTDVGSGAGAQSRAADAHLILRPQKSDGDSAKEQTGTLDVVCRSFPPTDQMFLRWDYPRWIREDRPQVAYEDNKAVMTPELFANRYFNEVWELKAEVQNRAEQDGMALRTFDKYLDIATSRKLLEGKQDDANKRKRVFRKLETRVF